MLRMSEAVYQRMVGHCYDGLPLEACGLLGGAPGPAKASVCYPTRNVAESSKLTFLRDLPKVFKGTHGDSPHVTFLKGEVVEVSADRPFTIYADGDPIGELPATVRVSPRSLRVLVPKGS